MRHLPVLLDQVIESLNLKPGSNVVDCTLGDAGHAEAILDKTSPNGKLLGIDADIESILRSKRYLYRYGDRAVLVRNNFSNLKQICEENNFEKVDAILLDLGWSTPQFAERGRGFSFLNANEPLDMRYGEKYQISNIKYQNENEMDSMNDAEEIINTYSKEELIKIFHQYGEEKFSDEIASEIVSQRKKKRIETVGDLVEIILGVYRQKLHSDKEIPWIGGIHPATKVFQAIRIAVNNELEAIKYVLPQAIEILKSGGRLSVITFHSLEDRIVKQYFRSQQNKLISIINKKPLIATQEELKSNPPSRSAKLRVVEKI